MFHLKVKLKVYKEKEIIVFVMSEIIRKRASESLGKEVLVFLYNNFRFEGKLINADETYLEILDKRSSSYKIIKIEEIKEMEVREGGE